jgi:putative FmdB family regulatory protein
MPTYDYQCTACSHTYSALHKMSDPAPACPACGATEVKKLLSAPAIHGRGVAAAAPMPAVGGGCGSGMCGHKH